MKNKLEIFLLKLLAIILFLINTKSFAGHGLMKFKNHQEDLKN